MVTEFVGNEIVRLVKPFLKTLPEIVPTRTSVTDIGAVSAIVREKVSVPLHTATAHAVTLNMPKAMFPPTKFATELPVNVSGNRVGLLRVPVVVKLTEFANVRPGIESANATSRTTLLNMNVLSLQTLGQTPWSLIEANRHPNAQFRSN